MKKLLLVIFFMIKGVYAHPHVFVDGILELKEIKDKNIVFAVRWYFDEFTSESLIEEYDLNRNRKLDLSEEKKVGIDFTKNLKEHQHFIQALINGKKKNIKVTSSHAEIIKRKMSPKIRAALMQKEDQMVTNFAYDFVFQVPITDSDIIKGKIEVYDHTIYSVIFPLKKMKIARAIKVKSNKLFASSCEYHFEISL